MGGFGGYSGARKRGRYGLSTGAIIMDNVTIKIDGADLTEKIEEFMLEILTAIKEQVEQDDD